MASNFTYFDFEDMGDASEEQMLSTLFDSYEPNDQQKLHAECLALSRLATNESAYQQARIALEIFEHSPHLNSVTLEWSGALRLCPNKVGVMHERTWVLRDMSTNFLPIYVIKRFDEDENEKGEIALADLIDTPKWVSKKTKPFSIELTTKARSYLLESDDFNVCNKWLAIISLAWKKHKQIEEGLLINPFADGGNEESVRLARLAQVSSDQTSTIYTSLSTIAGTLAFPVVNVLYPALAAAVGGLTAPIVSPLINWYNSTPIDSEKLKEFCWNAGNYCMQVYFGLPFRLPTHKLTSTENVGQVVAAWINEALIQPGQPPNWERIITLFVYYPQEPQRVVVYHEVDLDKEWFGLVQQKFANRIYPRVCKIAKILAVEEMNRWRLSIDPKYSWSLQSQQIVYQLSEFYENATFDRSQASYHKEAIEVIKALSKPQTSEQESKVADQTASTDLQSIVENKD